MATEQEETGTDAKGYDALYEWLVDRVRESENMIMYKHTRTGVTTSLILSVLESGRTPLIVEPHHVISRKTGRRIAGIAKEMGMDPLFVEIGPNWDICKRCIEKKEEYPVLAGFPYHPKPPCRHCEWRDDDEFTDDSFHYRGTDDYCHVHASIKAFAESHKDKSLAVFITPQKIAALETSQATGETQKLWRAANERIDTIIVDEYTCLVTQGGLGVDWLTPRFSLCAALEKENSAMEAYADQAGPKEERELGVLVEINRDLAKLRPCTDSRKRWKKVESPVDPEYRDALIGEYSSIYSSLIDFSAKTGYLPAQTIKTMVLARDPYLNELNLSTKNEPHIQYVAIPDVKIPLEWIRLREKDGTRIYATDTASPPVPEEALFPFRFREVLVPDFNQNEAAMLFVADKSRYTSYNLRGGSATPRRYREWVARTITAFDEAGYGDRMLVGFADERAAKIFRRKETWRDLGLEKPPIPYLHARGRGTQGVEYEERVMVLVGMPRPPRECGMPLANHLVETFGFRENPRKLAARIEEVSALYAAYQMASRVKDPLGLERSVVVLLGINAKEASKLVEGSERVLWAPPSRLESPEAAYLSFEEALGLKLRVAGEWLSTGRIDNPASVNGVAVILERHEKRFGEQLGSGVVKTVRDYFSRNHLYRKYGANPYLRTQIKDVLGRVLLE